jgi:DNA-binding MurR/RpiR family transcriptional regulator
MDEKAEESPESRLEQIARRKFQQRLAQHEQETRQKMLQAMRDNNADPAYIYAFEKTGLLVFQETMDQLEPEELERWAQAYEEYSEG